MNQCKTCKSQETGCGPKCLGWRTSCTVPLNLLRNVVLGKSRQHFLDIAVIFTPISHLAEWISLWEMVLLCILCTTTGEPMWTHRQKYFSATSLRRGHLFFFLGWKDIFITNKYCFILHQVTHVLQALEITFTVMHMNNSSFTQYIF